ncbi:MAG: rod shape-determining protein [Anaerolineaceae bacterium]|nr:rod shape-determining protein [Anaerolineaceae bacterium]MCY3935204.1 rod shape-determining protein [Chloroflexota bacterium]MCY4008549.1 rod shape-determining protein [Anaerolineaceae bacterium]MCY4107020.1 rod shape-determining protein [Chloroflexota bacterium]
MDRLLGLFSLDIGIDLGTAYTLVYVRGKGIILNEPSFVAIEKRSRRPLEFGSRAKEMWGKNPRDIVIVRPVRDGVISEFEITAMMLDHLIRRAHERSWIPIPRPRVVVGIPTGVTEVEKRAVYDATIAAGARTCYLIEEPVAAAIGAGLPVQETRGSMVIDIGGGTTEVAVFSLGGIVISRSIRVASDELDEDIIRYMRNKYKLMIGEAMAERVKIEIGSAYPLPQELTIDVHGRNLISGLPDTVELSSIEVREAISGSLNIIIDNVKDVLDDTPPELVADLITNGICMAGGGSVLQEITTRMTAEVNIRTWVADDPRNCVAKGAGLILENYANLSRLLVGIERGSTRH